MSTRALRERSAMSTSAMEQARTTGSSHPIPASWHADSREFIRGDSCGFEALDMQARLLAEACRTAARTTSEGPLLQQLARNGRLLVQAYRRIAAAAAASASVSTQNVGVSFSLTPDAE